MPVEFLKKSGEPEDPRLLKTRELVTRKEAELIKKENPEFEELLTQVDFEWMKKAFQAILARFKIDPDTINFVEPGMVVPDNSIRGLASYDPDKLIRINYEEIGKNLRWSSNPAVVLAIIILHEECHAISRNICVGYFDYDEEGRRNIKAKSGYAQHIIGVEGDKTVTQSESYSLFDEGVTEKIARELVIKYLESHPNLEDLNKRKKIYEDDSKPKVYNLAVSLVEAMIVKIANETGVSREMVWQAIVRGKIEGEDLGDADFREMFSEVFTSQFLKDLRTANVEEGQARTIPMMGSLGLGQIDPDLLKRIQKRINTYLKSNVEE